MKVLPNTVPELIEELEAAYPPKCKDPEESAEVHQRYAGKVALTQEMRRRFEAENKRESEDGLPKVIKR